MVEHQARRWMLKTRRPHSDRRWPVITVSRQYGARGAAIARSVADALGFRCWDQDLVHDIAQHAHAPERLLAMVDEHRRPAVAQLVETFEVDPTVTEHDYMRQLTRAVQRISQQGRAIIVGRGAQYLLEPETTMRVRIVAPLEYRVAGIAERNQVSREAAEREVQREDKARADFIRHHYDRDIADPTQYHLIINSAGYPEDRARDVVIEAYHALVGRLPAAPG